MPTATIVSRLARLVTVALRLPSLITRLDMVLVCYSLPLLIVRSQLRIWNFSNAAAINHNAPRSNAHRFGLGVVKHAICKSILQKSRVSMRRFRAVAIFG